jgi:hypothetical protein
MVFPIHMIVYMHTPKFSTLYFIYYIILIRCVLLRNLHLNAHLNTHINSSYTLFTKNYCKPLRFQTTTQLWRPLPKITLPLFLLFETYFGFTISILCKFICSLMLFHFAPHNCASWYRNQKLVPGDTHSLTVHTHSSSTFTRCWRAMLPVTLFDMSAHRVLLQSMGRLDRLSISC